MVKSTTIHVKESASLTRYNSGSWLATLLCVLVSSLSFYFSTGLGSIWLLAWIAPVPLLWLTFSRQPLWRVLVGTLVAFFLGNSEFIRPFFGMPAATIGVTMAVIAIAIAGAVVIGFTRFVHRRLGWWAALLAFPAAWTCVEYIASLTSPNGSVGSFAYTQVGAPVLIQSASLFGIWSITFLICLVASGVALALHERRYMQRILLIIAFVFGANLVFGIVQLDSSAGHAMTQVAAIAKDQPATRFASTAQTWQSITAAYAGEIDQVTANDHNLSAIVLPEKLATLDPQWRTQVIAPITAAAQRDHVRVIASFEDDTSSSSGRNIAVTFESNGSTATYAKRRLLNSEGNLTPGTMPGLLGDGTIVEICKDMDFPQMIRSDVINHAVGVIYVPAEDFTIDGWMHARIAAMRGVEDGASVVRSARKGLLTISDDHGAVLQRSQSSTAGFAVAKATVPIGLGDTLYLAIGDSFAWVSLALTLLLLVAATLRSHKKTTVSRNQ